MLPPTMQPGSALACSGAPGNPILPRPQFPHLQSTGAANKLPFLSLWSPDGCDQMGEEGGLEGQVECSLVFSFLHYEKQFPDLGHDFSVQP